MSTVGQRIGLFVIPLLLGFVCFNGVVMLVSPARWFALPRYLAFRATLRERDYMLTPVGRFQIRALGLILAGVTAWMIASYFGIPYESHTPGPNSVGVPLDWWLCVATCVGATGCGTIMLLKPSWWIMKYFRRQSVTEGKELWLERSIRALGTVFIGIGVYFLLQCRAI